MIKGEVSLFKGSLDLSLDFKIFEKYSQNPLLVKTSSTYPLVKVDLYKQAEALFNREFYKR